VYVRAEENMSNSDIIPQLSDYDVSETTGFALENPEVSLPDIYRNVVGLFTDLLLHS